MLAISGEQGSAKTVLSKMLKALIDTSAAPVRALPREERELNNGYLLAFDKLSGLPAWLSDTLCRLASGGSFAVRQLYTEGDEVDRLAAFTYGNMAASPLCKTSQQQSTERAFNKLTRTFAPQMEALKRYRIGGEQEGHGAARANVMLATWSIRKIGKTTLKLWMRPCTRVIIVVARENEY